LEFRDIYDSFQPKEEMSECVRERLKKELEASCNFDRDEQNVPACDRKEPAD
jgi:hypothetical protein